MEGPTEEAHGIVLSDVIAVEVCQAAQSGDAVAGVGTALDELAELLDHRAVVGARLVAQVAVDVWNWLGEWGEFLKTQKVLTKKSI